MGHLLVREEPKLIVQGDIRTSEDDLFFIMWKQIKQLRTPQMETKVFGIGFHKTGTSSLASALRQLGYRVKGPFGMKDERIGQRVYKQAKKLVDRYDAFQDNPWPVLYRELDEWCPNSKFILTIRPVDDWMRSVTRHFGGHHTDMREWIYGKGDPKGNEELYVSRYKRHNQEVLDYFDGRSDDFLVLKICNGDGWDKLCPFLELEAPDDEFPHAKKKVSGRKKTPDSFGKIYRRVKGGIVRRIIEW